MFHFVGTSFYSSHYRAKILVVYLARPSMLIYYYDNCNFKKMSVWRCFRNSANAVGPKYLVFLLQQHGITVYADRPSKQCTIREKSKIFTVSRNGSNQYAELVEIEIIFVRKLIAGQNLQFLLLGNSCEHHGFNISCDFVQPTGKRVKWRCCLPSCASLLYLVPSHRGKKSPTWNLRKNEY